MEDLVQLMEELRGESEPAEYQCLIIVRISGDAYLIESTKQMDEFLDGEDDLEVILSDYKNIPKEHGVYRCTICVHSYRSNHPEDPEEWDLKIWIKSSEKVEITL